MDIILPPVNQMETMTIALTFAITDLVFAIEGKHSTTLNIKRIALTSRDVPRDTCILRLCLKIILSDRNSATSDIPISYIPLFAWF